MFYQSSNLSSLDFRNATFDLVTTYYGQMFEGINKGITIQTKDNTTKSWLEARLSEAAVIGNVEIPV